MNTRNNDGGATEQHARLLAESYRKWTGTELIPLKPEASVKEQLDRSQIVVLSHGTESDPVLNYGNEMALRLWEMNWDEFTATPSRLTAEPMERQERERFFERVTADGFVSDYTGIRISSSGRRFYILKATVWNLIDRDGVYRGQAAAFSDYRYL